MRSILIILSIVICSYSFDPFSYFWTINTEGDTATVVKWKNNNDSVLVWANKLCDTINAVVPRWNWFSNHDSTFSWMNIDTIPGRVILDTIEVEYVDVSGSISIDTLQRLTLDTLYGSPVIDTVSGNFHIKGNLVVNSLNPTSSGAILSYDDYPNYRTQFFLPYTRYSGAWDAYGIRISPTMIGGVSGTGALEFSFSDDSISSETHSIDTLSYTSALTIQRNKYIFTPDSAYIGTSSDKDLLRLTTAKAFINGDLQLDSVVCTDLVASEYCVSPSFTSNNEDFFSYVDTVISDSLYEASTFRTAGTMRIIKIGSMVIASQQAALTYASIGTDVEVTVRGIPTEFIPNGVQSIPVVVKSAGVSVPGNASYSGSNSFVLHKNDGGYLAAGVSGLAITTFVWIH